MYGQAAYQNYLEASITTSDPLELTRMLYRGAIDAIHRAVAALEQGDIPARNKAIGKAQAIVGELASSLRPDAGEIAARLSSLYEYILHLLQTANFEQRREPLSEALALLETLRSAWEDCKPEGDPAVATAA